ncbi:LacI family DNA-binding transcriptional regulator [Halalkalibacterium halodurans]|uniref:LacI family transcriptional regulator n=1 Tax=Halalkalibacterium halodurans TaxID=86665 RepID=A0A0M0KK88_ALKHA|nr:LacI family DNA-binding transcriptional regulator [Halalkalibacterium halodurans]MED3645304.1 LacI family DNA-binding transcriptional regulator [Halalkalibacterium halodurans]TPE70960.1 LacI family transcriptional regulator [Halalkalibacterium halodurans]
MTTILDIAKLAGVAKSTVSRYLNGGSVSEPTRQKIERVIKETGYIPNAFAQSLKAKQTNFIGTIVPRLDSFAASRTVMGIDDELKSLGYQMLMSNTDQSVEREIETIYNLANQKIAGVILLATVITKEHLNAFREVGIPTLLVGQEHTEVPCLIHDDFKAGYEMGKHVLSKGHKRIAYLGVGEHDIAVGVKRKEGFKQAIAEHGPCEVAYFETSFSMQDSFRVSPKMIETYRPSALVCATDNIALGALKGAYSIGMNVPKDLSITGFGGYEVTGIIHPSLTTVNFHFKAAGKMAARKMIKLMNGEEVNHLTRMDVELIERESVDNV